MKTFPVLYVEDEEADVFLLRHAWEKADIRHPLHIGRDGSEARDYLAGKGKFAERDKFPLPGLVLLDLNLPMLSGLELLDWMRQQPGLRRLPVVIFSSSSRPEDVVRSYDAGANGYLVKPSSMGHLTALTTALRDFWLMHNQMPDHAA